MIPFISRSFNRPGVADKEKKNDTKQQNLSVIQNELLCMISKMEIHLICTKGRWTNRFCPLLAQWAGGTYWKHFEEIQLSIYTQAAREVGPNFWALDEIKYI